MKKKTIKLNVPECEVVLYRDCEWKRAYKNSGGGTVYGNCWQTINGANFKINVYVNEKFCQENKFSVCRAVLHECFHVTHMVWQSVSHNFDVNEHEEFALLHELIASEALKFYGVVK